MSVISASCRLLYESGDRQSNVGIAYAPLSSPDNKDCAAIILIDWVVGSPYFGTTQCSKVTTNEQKKIVFLTNTSPVRFS